MRKSHLLTGALAVLGLYSVSAQELSIDAEIRPRAEILHGFGEPAKANQDPGALISQRSALKLTYKTETITTHLNLQDVSVWGDRPQINAANGESTRIQEAWAKLNLGKGFSAKIGRQPLSYDDQRILGGLGWAQQARTHDVGVFGYVNDGLKIDAGFGFNQTGLGTKGRQETVFTASGAGVPVFQYKGIGFLHLSNKFSDAFSASFLFLGNSFQDRASTPDTIKLVTDEIDPATGALVIDPSTGQPAVETRTLTTSTTKGTKGFSNRYTSGVHLKYKKGAFGISGNGYYQFGKFGARDMSGFLAGVDATYKPGKTLFGLGYEYISGDDPDTADKNEAFFPLFGTNHKFNGFMDFFYVGNHANRNGLQDINAKVVIKTGAKSSLLVKAHQFLGAADNDAFADTFGTEIDLVFKTPIVKGAALIVGYSQAFLDDDFVEDRIGTTPSSDFNGWAWTMLVIKPNLFKWKKEAK